MGDYARMLKPFKLAVRLHEPSERTSEAVERVKSQFEFDREQEAMFRNMTVEERKAYDKEHAPLAETPASVQMATGVAGNDKLPTPDGNVTMPEVKAEPSSYVSGKDNNDSGMGDVAPFITAEPVKEDKQVNQGDKKCQTKSQPQKK